MMFALYLQPMSPQYRRDLLIEWLGTRRIIRLAHKHGLYGKAARARARQRAIEHEFKMHREGK